MRMIRKRSNILIRKRFDVKIRQQPSPKKLYYKILRIIRFLLNRIFSD